MKKILTLLVAFCVISTAAYAAAISGTRLESKPTKTGFPGVRDIMKDPYPSGVRPIPVPPPPVYDVYYYSPAYRENKNTNIINNNQNTVIINQAEGSTNVEKTPKQQVKKVETEEEKNEQERMALLRKYPFLNNSTLNNEVICSRMEDIFNTASCDELERVLNTVLKLNCDLSPKCVVY